MHASAAAARSLRPLMRPTSTTRAVLRTLTYVRALDDAGVLGSMGPSGLTRTTLR